METDQETSQGPLLLSQVLEEEYTTLHGPLPDDYPKDGSEDNRLTAIVGLIHQLPKKRAALCLSGGGIRSATFGLGVLQGLAHHHLLDKFDYVSTVSGGGYVGSWLTAWIHRQGVQKVVTDLRGVPESTTPPLPTALRQKVDPEPPPIRHLRAYSNYITPRLGLLSADTWTVMATYLRNLLLNWFVLVPLLAAALLVPRFGVPIIGMDPDALLHTAGWFRRGALGLGFLLTAVAIAYMSVNLPSVNEAGKVQKGLLSTHRDQDDFLLFCWLPLMVASILLVTYWAWHRNTGSPPPQWWSFALFGAVLHCVGWLPYIVRSYQPQKLGEFPAIFISGALGGILGWWIVTSIPLFLHHRRFAAAYVCFAAPLLLAHLTR